MWRETLHDPEGPASFERPLHLEPVRPALDREWAGSGLGPFRGHENLALRERPDANEINVVADGRPRAIGPKPRLRKERETDRDHRERTRARDHAPKTT